LPAGGLVVVVVELGGGVVVVVVVVVVVCSGDVVPPPPGWVIGVVPPGGLLPPSFAVVVVVLDVVVFDVDEALVDELLLVVSLVSLVVSPLASVVRVVPPSCCEAGSTFWFCDCGVAPCPAAMVATEANAVATTTPAAAIITLADDRGAPLRLGGLNNARSGSLTPPPSSAARAPLLCSIARSQARSREPPRYRPGQRIRVVSARVKSTQYGRHAIR
jgi:hypothetical protein